LQWHLEHTRNCACRPFPKGLMEKLSEVEKRRIENEAQSKSA
jgi:hypothetical protein